jgi:hypothetical protein
MHNLSLLMAQLVCGSGRQALSEVGKKKTSMG